MGSSFSQTYLPFLLWFAALIFSLMPFDAWQDHFMLASIVLMFAGGASVVAGMRDLVPPHRSFWMIGSAFWGLALVSVLFSEARGVSFVYFCFFSALPISALLFFRAAQRMNVIYFGLKCLGVFYAVLSLSCIIQFLFFPEILIPTWGLVAWPLSNPNSLAGLMSLGFFGTVGVMLGAPNRLYSNLALVLAVCVFTGMIMTGSRGAFIGMLLCGAVFLLCNPSFVRKHVRCLSILFVLCTVMFFGVSYLGETNGARPMDVLSYSLDGRMPLLWTRPAIWTSTIEMARDYFWTGTGIGTFFLYYPEYRSVDDLRSAGYTAHSDPLQFWSEMGVFGLVLFYAFCFVALWRCICAVRRLDAGDPKRLWVLSPFCALGAMLAHAHVSFHFNILPTLCVAGAMLGVWMYMVREVEAAAPLQAVHVSPPVRGVAAGLFLLALVVFSIQHISDIFVTRGRASLQQGDFESYVDDINLAGRMSAQTNPRALISAALIPLSVIEQQGEMLSKAEGKKQFDKAWALLEKAEHYNPRLVPLYLMRAQLMMAGTAYVDLKPGESVEGRIEAELVKGLEMNQLHLETRMALARFYFGAGRKDDAYRVLRDGVDWPYDSPMLFSFYQLLLQQAAERGDKDTRDYVSRKLKRAMRQ